MNRFMRFWFEPARPIDLAVCRILFFGFLFYTYVGRDFGGYADVAAVSWSPIWTFETLGFTPPSQPLLESLQIVWKSALLFCCIGLLTRVSTIAAFLLGFYLLGLGHNFGKVTHDNAVVVLTMGILAFSRCGDAISIDSLLRRKKTSPNGEYRWPIRAVWLLVSLIFLAAGTAKLRVSGLAWMNGENLATTILRQHYFGEDVPGSALGLFVAQRTWLCTVLAVGAIVIECGLILSLFHRYLRVVFVPCGVLMLFGFPLIMGPFPRQLIASFLFWVPWEAIGTRLLRPFRRPRDGAGGLFSRQRRLDVPSTSVPAWPAVRSRANVKSLHDAGK